MMRTTKRILTLSILVLGGLVLQAGAALACYSNCVRVDPNHPFCKRCQDVGVYTGITCQDIGQCGCIFTQNTCSPSAAVAQTKAQQTDLAAFLQADDDGVVCSATSTAVAAQ
ncbi:MAG: hypothetical protein WAM82_27180 [Thermoanaerobaculia bacterium]